jgi:hypothetical protein
MRRKCDLLYKTRVVLLILLATSALKAQDTLRPGFWRVGLIPYQVFSRSSALYYEQALRKNFSIEFRLGYTYSQPSVESHYEYDLAVRGYFLYSGENGMLAYCGRVRRMKFSMFVAQRYWTYTNVWLPCADAQFAYQTHYLEQKSSYLFGLGIGFGFEVDLLKRSKHLDAAFFANASFIQCWIHDTFTDARGDNLPQQGLLPIFPRQDDRLTLQPSIGMGFKIGFKKSA